MPTVQPTQFTISKVPAPNEGERPANYADRVGMWYVAQRSAEYRKEHGLYLTPVPVADFMAEKIKVNNSKFRILDPAAGSGILCCAVVESVASRNATPAAIELVAYEVNVSLATALRAVLQYLANWCRCIHGVIVDVRVEFTDFILAQAGVLQFSGQLPPKQTKDRNFDVVISNPPYFKISKSDPRAAVAFPVVHGQPNIYALFMAISASLLRKQGDFVFITPRSFASGFNFRQFRTFFFNLIRPTTVHVFGSRRDTFSRDDVLQENIIVSGIRQDGWHQDQQELRLTISSTSGVLDLDELNVFNVSMNVALNLETEDKVLRLPLNDDDREALTLVDSWPCSLHRFGLKISTGPVVPFRASALIESDGKVPASYVPLLWMNHVRSMRTTWPLNQRKAEYIKRSGAEALLLPNKNYVLIRRFSSKEEPRRLTAAPYVADTFDIPEVGFENHLNYIHRPNGALSRDEALGLAALYNSRLLDTYFRAANGNTQVSATELRSIPLPTHETIIALAQRMKHLSDPIQNLDATVMALVGQPKLREACED